MPARFEHARLLCAPRRAVRYQLGKLLGEGGFGVCYELVDLDGNKFAGKFVSKNTDENVKVADAERRIQGALKHRNVVNLIEVIQNRHWACFVMELCSRESLFELCFGNSQVDECEVRFFMQQLLSGLKYVHSRKIIHRDIKPENLLINDKFDLKVADFGLAIPFAERHTKEIAGTTVYMAPEIFKKQGYSYSSDIWAAGCILYGLLVGKLPFDADNDEDVERNVLKRAPNFPSTVSPVAESLIKWMLKKDPRKRPTVNQVLGHAFMKGRACLVVKKKSRTQADKENSGRMSDMEQKTQQLMGPQSRVTGARKRQRSECIDDDKDSPLNKKWMRENIGPLKMLFRVVPDY